MFSSDIKAQPEYEVMISKFHEAFDVGASGAKGKDTDKYQRKLHQLNLEAMEEILVFLNRENRIRCRATIAYLKGQL